MLALQYHPDRNQSTDAAELFNNIKEAYSILSNRVEKNKYDVQLFKNQPNLHDLKKINGDKHLVEISRNILYQLQHTRIEKINTALLNNFLTSILDKDNIIIILKQSSSYNLYLFFENIWKSITYLPPKQQLGHLKSLISHLEQFKDIKLTNKIVDYTKKVDLDVKKQKTIPYIIFITAAILCLYIYYISE